jgi:hypothetical protein
MPPAATPEGTFNLFYVSPQDHTMNLSIGKRLEEWTRQVGSSSSSSSRLWW